MSSDNNLNRNGFALRAMQAVLQSGVGGMTDFPNQSLMMGQPEKWRMKKNIFDDRFAKSLGVKYFALPIDVGFVRFPRWYYCPKCHKFQDMDKWTMLYQRMNPKQAATDPEMALHMDCPMCRVPLIPAGFVVACPSGHIDDFPWVEWLHCRAHKPVCGRPELKLTQTGAEGLEGLHISCCFGARSTLKTIMQKNAMERCANESGNVMAFKCKGHFQFNNKTDEKCVFYPNVYGRGNSAIYFPLSYSSLVIPPYADKVRTRIEQSAAFERCLDLIEDEETEEDKRELIESKLSKWAQRIADEVKESGVVVKLDEVESILRQKWLEEADAGEADDLKYKIDEYEALNGTVGASKYDGGDFMRVEKDIREYNVPKLKSVALIEKVRVVSALVGFSRVNPVSSMDGKGFVDVKMKRTDWYPANEVRGEGIFLEFDSKAIDDWVSKNPAVVERAKMLEQNVANTSVWKPRHRITPRFLMLHTLSHLLIRQLSFECGYGIASLNERIYCAEKEEGKDMAGIFIYTANGDVEGTLGGLVRQGQPDVLPRVIKEAIETAFTCSNDPVCMMSKGQGREALNLAACYACALLPETCCEERNALLDRVMVVGTFENRKLGFLEELEKMEVGAQAVKHEDVKNDWLNSHKEEEAKKEEGDTIEAELAIRYLPGELLKKDYSNWEEASVLFNGLDARMMTEEEVPLPMRYGGKFVINNKDSINILASWDDTKKVLVEDECSDAVARAIEKMGWEVLDGNDTSELIKKIKK